MDAAYANPDVEMSEIKQSDMWHPISERRRTNLRIMLLPRTAKDFPRSSKSPFDFRKEIRKQPVVKVRFALKECVSLCRLQRFNTSVRPCYRTGTNGPMAMPNPKHVEACFSLPPTI